MVSIGDKKIGDGFPCYITFEIGPTHNGLASAKRLIKAASESGADAVKFQMFDPERLISNKDQMFSYGVLKQKGTEEVEIIQEPIYNLFLKRSFTRKEWTELKQYCDELNIDFFSTVGFLDEVDFLEKLGCKSIKIASADVNHLPLIRKAAKTGMCIQLDTGMSTIGEIEIAVDAILAEGNDNIILHQCPSGYPARIDSINLNIIKTLKKMFSFPVAFSDHSPGKDMDIAAVALGANLIEKTITEDRYTRSVEHSMSIEIEDFRDFVITIKDIEKGLGVSRRLLSPIEKEERKHSRRSIFLSASAKAGEYIRDCQIEFRRPGFGISPDYYEKILDSKLIKNLDSGSMLKMSDFR